MALVYEGRRESLAGVSPRVAIKLILPEHASSETFKELFINEARLGASMQHQNLVQIQDFDCEGETYFLVMEYVEGLTLRKLIGFSEKLKTRIPLGVVAELGRQACDGLHYAHTARDERGRPIRLVHRDIKPSNLILGPQGVVKVLDFGISKGRLREERKGSVKGTWGYMAPEQAVGAEVGPTADIFGLAVVLYELASLRPMFQDQNKDEMRRLLRDDHAARMAATLDGPTYGPMIGVLVRALQRDPSARYETAEAFGRALSSLLPDPITARDEVTRFYDRIEALDRGSRPPASARSGITPPGSMVPTRAQEPNALSGVVTFVAGATLSLALLGGVAVVGLLAWGRTVTPEIVPEVEPEVPVAAGTAAPPVPMVEPPGPAGEGAPGEVAQERRPPIRSLDPEPFTLTEPSAARMASKVIDVVRPPLPEEGEGVAGSPGGGPIAPAAPEPAAEPGTLTVDARQDAEVYIESKYVSKAPAQQELAPGTYNVLIVAKDGRRRTFDVEITAAGKVKKVWDFDRMEWR